MFARRFRALSVALATVVGGKKVEKSVCAIERFRSTLSALLKKYSRNRLEVSHTAGFSARISSLLCQLNPLPVIPFSLIHRENSLVFKKQKLVMSIVTLVVLFSMSYLVY